MLEFLNLTSWDLADGLEGWHAGLCWAFFCHFLFPGTPSTSAGLLESLRRSRTGPFSLAVWRRTALRPRVQTILGEEMEGNRREHNIKEHEQTCVFHFLPFSSQCVGNDLLGVTTGVQQPQPSASASDGSEVFSIILPASQTWWLLSRYLVDPGTLLQPFQGLWRWCCC